MKISTNIQIFIGALLGVMLGLFISKTGADTASNQAILYWVSLIGSTFINMLKMILIPLVFTSIAVGIANLRAHAQMSKVWKLSLGYYLTTTGLAVLIGLVFVNVFKPGKGITIESDVAGASQLAQLSVSEFFANLMSQLFISPIEAMANGQILGTIIFAIFLGIALVVRGEKSKTVISFLSEFFELIMLVVSWIMKILPIGIMALLAKLVATQDMGIFSEIGKYVGVVVGATLFHGFVILPTILVVVGKKNLREYYSSVKDALITAFSTSSSSATLPVTVNCVENNLKVNKDVAGFVLPLGATINMDGTALYEAVAAIFIANLVGIELSLMQQIVVFLMSIVASIGAPGIPSAGMVTLMMVLSSVGLPIEYVPFLYTIDRPLDAVRTMVNVKGDTIGSVVIDRLTSKSS